MASDALSVRYAHALFGMARKTNQMEEQLGELIKAELVLRENAPLRHALQSPTVPSTVKKSILQQVLGSRITPQTLHFLYVLVDKNREIYVESIIEAYRELLRTERGQVQVIIESAAPLSPAVQKQVDDRMREYTGKKVELKYEVNPELLGGLVIRLGDRIIDGGVRHQLSQIHERLTKAGAAAVGG